MKKVTPLKICCFEIYVQTSSETINSAVDQLSPSFEINIISM